MPRSPRREAQPAQPWRDEYFLRHFSTKMYSYSITLSAQVSIPRLLLRGKQPSRRSHADAAPANGIPDHVGRSDLVPRRAVPRTGMINESGFDGACYNDKGVF